MYDAPVDDYYTSTRLIGDLEQERIMKDPLIGKKIIELRPMTSDEIESEEWTFGTTVIVLNNGTILYASADAEGNNPGILFGIDKDGQAFGI